MSKLFQVALSTKPPGVFCTEARNGTPRECVCVWGGGWLVRGRDTCLCWAAGSEILEMPV